jgi:hypothetical protein
MGAVPRSRILKHRFQTGLSRLDPHWLHVMFRVSMTRAIVECMPQFGHSERSSNRRRQ